MKTEDEDMHKMGREKEETTERQDDVNIYLSRCCTADDTIFGILRAKRLKTEVAKWNSDHNNLIMCLYVYTILYHFSSFGIELCGCDHNVLTLQAFKQEQKYMIKTSTFQQNLKLSLIKFHWYLNSWHSILILLPPNPI